MSYIRQSRVQPDRLDTCASIAWTQVRNIIRNLMVPRTLMRTQQPLKLLLLCVSRHVSPVPDDVPNTVHTVEEIISELDLVDGRVLISVLAEHKIKCMYKITMYCSRL